MPDDPAKPEESTPSDLTAAAAPKPRSFLRRHWGKLTIAAIVLTPGLVFAIWAAATLGFTYSSGERVGYVQKLSLKGWLCKTWEGELQMSAIPGSAPLIFPFTVRSDSLARVIQTAAGKQVALHYEEHQGVPTTCFGESAYYVVGVRVLTGR
jgi:hypothetical protein